MNGYEQYDHFNPYGMSSSVRQSDENNAQQQYGVSLDEQRCVSFGTNTQRVIARQTNQQRGPQTEQVHFVPPNTDLPQMAREQIPQQHNMLPQERFVDPSNSNALQITVNQLQPQYGSHLEHQQFSLSNTISVEISSNQARVQCSMTSNQQFLDASIAIESQSPQGRTITGVGQLQNFPDYSDRRGELMLQSTPKNKMTQMRFFNDCRDYSMLDSPHPSNVDYPMTQSLPDVQVNKVVEPRGLGKIRVSEISPNPAYIPPVLPIPFRSYSVNIPLCIDSANILIRAPPYIPPVFDDQGNLSQEQLVIPFCQREIQDVPDPVFSANDWVVSCDKIELKMKNWMLWSRFDSYDMEMCVSKTGRKLFPPLQFDIDGLVSSMLYTVYLDFVLADEKTWKFEKSSQQWIQSHISAVQDPSKYNGQVYHHPSSPTMGYTWNERGISFDKLHISNHLQNPGEKIFLKTTHRYIPRLIVVEAHRENPNSITRMMLFVMAKTRFIAVTQHQNQSLKQLKFELNPNANSFLLKERRDDVTKRKYNDKTVTSSVTQLKNSIHCSSNQLGSERLRDDQQTFCDSAMIVKDRVSSGRNSGTCPIVASADLINLGRRTCYMAGDGILASDGIHTLSDKTSLEPQKARETNAASSADLGRRKQPVQQLLNLNSVSTFNTVQHRERKEGNPTSSTVHHFPLAYSGLTRKSENVDEIAAPKTSLDKYELLNMDRCIPPNATASVNNVLPFDKTKVQAANKTSGQSIRLELPVFFKCNYYRWQVAQEVLRARQSGATLNLNAFNDDLYWEEITAYPTALI